MISLCRHKEFLIMSTPHDNKAITKTYDNNRVVSYDAQSNIDLGEFIRKNTTNRSLFNNNDNLRRNIESEENLDDNGTGYNHSRIVVKELKNRYYFAAHLLVASALVFSWNYASQLFNGS